MKLIDIFEYFASKGMGSKFLQTIDVIWEKLDEIEKQMVSTVREYKAGNLIIKSKLSQQQLEEEVTNTPFVTL